MEEKIKKYAAVLKECFPKAIEEERMRAVVQLISLDRNSAGMIRTD